MILVRFETLAGNKLILDTKVYQDEAELAQKQPSMYDLHENEIQAALATNEETRFIERRPLIDFQAREAARRQAAFEAYKDIIVREEGDND